MKNKLLLFAGYLSAFTSFAQVYSDSFDNNLTVNDTQSYDAELLNGNLVITGNGTAGAYQSFFYQTHENGTLGSIDISSDLILYIKAKGENLPDLRIDLKDINGYASNYPDRSQRLTDDFEILTYNFNGDLLYAYDENLGCTTDTPCTVDATQIETLSFFINAANGEYNDTIELEWLSFGEPLEALPEASEFDIRYNQLGYTVNEQKIINITGLGSFENKAYEITNSEGEVIINSNTESSIPWIESGENIVPINITEINTVGTYTFSIDEMSISFKVLEDPYTELREEAFKYYYYNRASTEITTEYAGEFARAAGHPDNDVIIHKSAATNSRPEGDKISAPKGWYDAGDYNKYIVNSGISTYTLLAAFEHYPNYFTETTFNIPEAGGALPDVLDEAKWNLDWMLAMQDPSDGGVYHKLTGLNFSGSIMPADYTFDRYVVKKSTAATLDFAAVMATASRVYTAYDSNYSNQMLQAAINAYQWAQNNPEEYYLQPNTAGSAGDPLLDDVVTGEYGDINLSDEFVWAATELYIATQNETYGDDINVSSFNGSVPGWQNVSTLGLYSIANFANDLPSGPVSSFNQILNNKADELVNTINSTSMNVAMTSSDFVWGSNGIAANQIMLLINVYKLTEDDTYLDAAYKALDYLFGRNGTGYSYLTGFGDETPLSPHHRISEYDGYNVPVPGMLVGGPHTGFNDVGTQPWECNESIYLGTNPANAYAEDYCSYATNEVTINWNAPVVYVLHALKAIQDENTGGTLSNADNYTEAFAQKFNVYPNPTIGELNITALENNQNASIEVFTLKGEKIITESFDVNEKSINLSSAASGVYLMKITLGEQSYTTKIVKQ